MPPDPIGRLAIWHDCAPGYEADFETWYQTEHLAERLSVPGFRRGRRYEAIERGGGYFTCYEVDDPDVLTSRAYVDRVNNPTPMTTHVMRAAFRDMSRTICEAHISIGRLRGAFAATLFMDALPDPDQLRRWAEDATRAALIARMEGWRAVDFNQPQSAEERLRGGDSQIRACLFVETLREEGCRLLRKQLAQEFGVPADRAKVFRLLCDLANE